MGDFPFRQVGGIDFSYRQSQIIKTPSGCQDPLLIKYGSFEETLNKTGL
jgi:hypothetical protein